MDDGIIGSVDGKKPGGAKTKGKVEPVDEQAGMNGHRLMEWQAMRWRSGVVGMG